MSQTIRNLLRVTVLLVIVLIITRLSTTQPAHRTGKFGTTRNLAASEAAQRDTDGSTSPTDDNGRNVQSSPHEPPSPIAAESISHDGNVFVGFEEIVRRHSRPFSVQYPPPMGASEHTALIDRTQYDLISNLTRLTDSVVPEESKGDVRRPAAIFTLVHNEAVFVRAWIAHYGHTFLPRDMYILDNNLGRDGTLEAFAESGFNIIPVPCDAYYNDHNCLRASVSTAAASLLAAYKTVVFSEVDEFLFATKPDQTLWSYLCSFKKEAVRVDTRTIIENRTEEVSVLMLANTTLDFSKTSVSPPFNWNMETSTGGGRYGRQRYYWYKDSLYRKPLIFTRPMRWANGFHYARFGPPMTSDGKGRPRPVLDFLASKRKKKQPKKYPHVLDETTSILLLHVHRVDKAYFTQRGVWKSKQTQRDAISPHAKYNGSKLETFYWGDWNEYDTLREPIPVWWLEVEERHLLSRPASVCP